MGKWNYRLVKYHDGESYGLHEVYYNEEGEPDGMTTNPILVFEAFEARDVGPQSIAVDTLSMMIQDIVRHSILEQPVEWAEPKEEDKS